ncbi:hypothetical protein [Acidicapsa acidisoli]|uniref:hypothetical protein n=1 Tax=Acidicapsa acidisoli TaxID=1615681 RepID=UPI0021DFD658|nr:hypothetical protein [Acidicapsa acidisoli]
MSCELYKSEMYAWRPGDNLPDSKPLLDHLGTCPECAQWFANFSASDERIRQTFSEIPESPSLEAKIFASLDYERLQKAPRKSSWRNWFLLPIAASLLLGVTLRLGPWLQDARLSREVATLLSQPPSVEINSTDQKQLLDWSARALSGDAELPPELSKIEFRAASSLKVASHRAVLLKMKNEQRASLLIIDARLTAENTIKSFHETAGSDSRWSDGRRTYVLLFQGSEQDMHAYMTQMGIVT